MTWEDHDMLKLMVVDDEPDNLDLLYRTFRRDFEVYKAEDGFKALEVLETVGEMAVIISDQRMPRMNGTEFLSRTVEQFPDTIRIVLTGYTDVEDLVEAINSGKVFKYITKPWNPQELKSVVTQAAETFRVVKQRTQVLTQALARESFFNEVMSVIRESLDYHNMLQTIVTTLGKTFDASHAVLYAVEANDHHIELGKALKFNRPQPDATSDACLESHSLSASEAVLRSGELKTDTVNLDLPLTALTVPLGYQQTTLAIVTLYHSADHETWAEATAQLLSSVAEQIALAISQAKLYQRIQKQTQQMRAELEVARQIQTNLLRQSVPAIDSVRIQARCLPAREVGGDFYEIFFPSSGAYLAGGGRCVGQGRSRSALHGECDFGPAARTLSGSIALSRQGHAKPKPQSLG